jgi:MFS family permease
VVGVLLAANRLIRIPGNLLAGALNDRVSPRRLFLLGLCLGMLSTLSYGLVRGFWPLLGGRLLWGTAWALINVTGYTMVLDWSTSVDRGRMMGFYQMAFMVGLAISPVLGGVLTDALGFRTAVLLCAAISGAGLLVAIVALPETRRPVTGPRGRFWGGAQRQRLAALAGAWRQMDRSILSASYIYLVTFFVNGGVLMSTIGLYLGRRWGTSISVNEAVIGVATLAGAMLAMRALLGMLAGPLAGIISDRLRNRWPVVRGGIVLGVVGFMVLALSSAVWSMPAGVALVALSAGALITVLAALVGDLTAGDRQGISMGGLATAGDIGSATGPLVAYALAVVLDLRWVYLLCAAALASGLIATLRQGRAE